jgi:thiamine biosynthesis lipoprotein
MGTVFTVDIRDPGSWDHAIADTVRWLHRVDDIFSTFRANSDISRIRRGALAIADADPYVADVIDRCLAVQRATEGYFSPRWSGQLDPTGLVKGWAIELASHQLRRHGSANHAINGGGDVQTAGAATPGQPWGIGVIDPFDRTSVIGRVAGHDLAVATSGTAERGAHIVNPFTGRPATELASVTVMGSSIIAADCYATAAMAMGAHALGWLETVSGYEALVVTAEGTMTRTRGFAAVRSANPAIQTLERHNDVSMSLGPDPALLGSSASG